MKDEVDEPSPDDLIGNRDHCRSLRSGFRVLPRTTVSTKGLASSRNASTPSARLPAPSSSTS